MVLALPLKPNQPAKNGSSHQPQEGGLRGEFCQRRGFDAGRLLSGVLEVE